MECFRSALKTLQNCLSQMLLNMDNFTNVELSSRCLHRYFVMIEKLSLECSFYSQV